MPSSPVPNLPDATLTTERVLHATPQQVFAAFEQPGQLAQWWGPQGFTNTFEQFEFTPGGRWVFVMHGPNGANYPNESLFREIVPAVRIVIEHVVAPWFTLAVGLAPHGDGHTRLTWAQTFESAELAAKVRSVAGPANEQNLDRLAALLQALSPPAAS